MDEGKDAGVIANPDQDGGPKDAVAPHEEISPERQLVREIRAKALAGKTKIEDIAAFDQSTAGTLLGVLEDSLQFRELLKLVPYFKDKIAGDIQSGMNPDEGRGFSLRLPGYRIQVREEGAVEILPPMKGMDDSLLYETGDPFDRIKSGAVMRPKTGRVELFNGEPIKPSSEARIRSMLEVTRGYFSDVRRATPDMANAARMGLSPDMSLPRFPTTQMNQVRAVPASLR